MNDAQAAALRLAARLLSYPNTAFLSTLPQLKSEAEMLLADESTAQAAKAALAYIGLLQSQTVARSAQRYVAIFDHTPAASLYMTWHRYGNDRSQGKAMAALNGLYRTAGLEPVEGDMPDYLPRMLEFLSVAPEWACDAILDGFGPELDALIATLKQLNADQADFLNQALQLLRREFPARFEARKGPDSTRRPMAQPEPEPTEPLILPPDREERI